MYTSLQSSLLCAPTLPEKELAIYFNKTIWSFLNTNSHLIHQSKDNDSYIGLFLNRVSDYIKFQTSNWTDIFVKTLREMVPPNVEVVGPNIPVPGFLMYEFTPTTHINIHGFYYPREYLGLHDDRRICDVYDATVRMKKLKTVRLDHLRIPSKYKLNQKSAAFHKAVKEKGRRKISEWLKEENTKSQGYMKRFQIIVFCVVNRN